MLFSLTEKNHIIQHQKEITTQICWIPAQCEIEPNEKAAHEDKEGLNSEPKLNTGLGKKEIYIIIIKHKIKEWQKKWDGNTKGRKLYAIVPKIDNFYFGAFYVLGIYTLSLRNEAKIPPTYLSCSLLSLCFPTDQ